MGSDYNSSCMVFFGNEIMVVLHWAKEHWYLAIPIAVTFGGGIIYYFNKATKNGKKDVR